MPTMKSKSRKSRSDNDVAARRGPRRLKSRPTKPAKPTSPDFPYTMRLNDGRTIYVEIPGDWVTKDRSGEIGFRPPAVKLLDKLHALALSTADRRPSPGYLATLRVALGLTQKEFSEKLGVDKITVSRWERGEVTPSADSLSAIDEIRKAAVRKGVVIGG